MPFKITKLGQEPVEQPQYNASNENIAQTIARNVARVPVTATKALASIPGEIEELGKGAINLAGRALPGGANTASLLGVPKEFVPNAPKGNIIPTDEKSRVFPTYEQLGKGIKEKAPYLAPQGEKEELADTAISNAVNLLAGGVGAGRAAVAGAAGPLAGYLTKNVTGSEAAGNVADIGTTLLTSVGFRRPLKAKSKQNYDYARSLLPEEATFKSPKLSAQIDHELNALKRSDMLAKDYVNTRLKELRKIVGPNGTVDINELWKRKKQLNEHLYSRDLPQGAEFELEKMRNWLNEVLRKEYGTKNPEFSKALENADKFYEGINQATSIEKFIKSKLKGHDLNSPITKGILGIGGTIIAGGNPITTAKYAAGAYGLREATYFLETLGRSLAGDKIVAKEYGKMLGAAAKKNGPLTIKYAHKLDDALSKESRAEQQPQGRFKVTKIGS